MTEMKSCETCRESVIKRKSIQKARGDYWPDYFIVTGPVKDQVKA